jgi:glycosyltransferase involved in cell wall biosynthesis
MIGLLRKGVATLAYDGPLAFVDKTQRFVRRKVTEKRDTLARHHIFKDVLFVNGCTLEHPARYRVDHQMEQLHFSGFATDKIFYESLDVDLARFYRAFVFFRCPHTAVVEEFIRRAKAWNRPVLFDIDDLVIDDEYVRTIKYLATMTGAELDLYMDGVRRMKRTLSLCDGAITTTHRLALELEKYTPQVFVNRNVASEKMVALSNQAIEDRRKHPHQGVVLGYFSGSITHNDDVRMILPALVRILQDFPQVRLKVAGHLDLPPELRPFAERVTVEKFVSWTRLPRLIASADINLAPIEESIFNEAKSENKWIEASLVEVPTVASDHGAVARMAKDGETVVLCGQDDWYRALAELIASPAKREAIGRAARAFVLEKCVTAHTATTLARIVRSKMPTGIAFVLPSTQLSGGINVALRHASIAQRHGADVALFSMDYREKKTEISGMPVVPLPRIHMHAHFDRAVATLWSTADFVNGFPKFASKYYLVQNYETDFYRPGNFQRVLANTTYNFFTDLRYVTISRWCQDWLWERFGKKARYAPNGIDLTAFTPRERDFSGKVRILVEGSSTDHYKNVDESFAITNQLDPARFEVWYLSYEGGPKKGYRVDRFLHRVPHVEVAEIYRQCHILVKSSRLESFSYPPLEMMATGGIALVAANAGNAEYLRDRENCLLYQVGHPEQALGLIAEICGDAALRERIIRNGLTTARSRDWRAVEGEVRKLYDL